ncbi:MAG: hypothetical protein QOE66_3359 [Chloroflexota bacterium]|nr:hypothetical protein [Chloroflexota bacterium]
MSDHEADFSANGHDASGHAVATETQMGASGPDENAFLDELARAMQAAAAAEQARNAEGTEQRRQTHIDAIRAREALEAEDLRELAKDDVKGIDAWSDGEIKRIKLERERRIAARRDQLQIRLEEHRNVVSREVEAVEAAIATYKAQIEVYFRNLEAETDPVVIAKHAGTRPPFPVLDDIGPDQTPRTSDSRQTSPAVVASQVSHAEAVAVEAPPAEVAPVAEAAAVEEPTAEGAQAEGSRADQPDPVIGYHADGTAPGDTSLIGVMDPDPAADSTEKPWEADTDEAAPVESSSAEAQPAAEEQPVAEAQPVADGEAAGAEAAGANDGAPEPVGAVAEARVVMPKATGAGSWLRWPNSSADHSDNSQ